MGLKLGKQSDGTFAFHADRMAELTHKVDVLNRRVRKTGGSGLGLELVRTEVRSHKPGHVTPIAVVRITGTVPTIGGHTFIARIEHHGAIGNVVTRAPNAPATVALPEHYRTASAECEHCKTNRKRNDTFVLSAPTGALHQIGRNCLADFLRSNDADHALRMWSLLASIEGLLGSDDESMGSKHGHEYVTVTHFLACAAATIRLDGWLSRTAVREQGCGRSSSDAALFLAGPCPNSSTRTSEWQRGQPTDRDLETAADTMEWVQSLAERPDVSDYLHNVRVACSLGYLEPRNAGIVASAIVALQKEREQEIARRKRAERGTGKHVGKVGERLTFDTLTVVRIRSVESEWGCKTIVALEDVEGNEFTWFATGSRSFNAGEKVRGKGTVKAHNSYKERPQTVLTRCAFEVVSAD